MTAKPPIVFLGPSMKPAEAEQILDADYRPPIRRGDLSTIEPGRVVAIIDGVFEQDLAVSPAEILSALDRGIVIYGGGSMGALRAAEVPGVVGVGRIYSWYRTGVVTRDDEVALLFEDDTYRPLTVPTVNVRYAIERLSAPGTIDRETAERLLAAALSLPFKARTYRAILKAAGLDHRLDSSDLISMLGCHDLKNLDAHSVLEAVETHAGRNGASASSAAEQIQQAGQECHGPADAASGIFVWESGDRVNERELFDFLICTGRIGHHARRVMTRPGQTEPPLTVAPSGHATVNPQSVLNGAARRWGWRSAEEAQVTLADLSLGLHELNEYCITEAYSQGHVDQQIRQATPAFVKAIIADMFFSDLALKREAMRLGSLQAFARRVVAPVEMADLEQARTILCKINGEFGFQAVRRRWARLGITDTARQDAFVETIARARKSGRVVADAMTGATSKRSIEEQAEPFELPLGSCPKPRGEPRFCMPTSTAADHANRLRDVIGVSRVGMIGELADLGHIQIAQAARPGGAWSSSYGSGKSCSRDGAIVGSIMEEVEKWTQERFVLRDDETVRGSFPELGCNSRVVDPAYLDLPYDSPYHPELQLDWVQCADLLNGGGVYIPADVVQLQRRKADIAYSKRAARKTLATNGLASGFSREEALLHAICEYVERHAARIADLYISNPGGLQHIPYTFIDLDTLAEKLQGIVSDLSANGTDAVKVLDITSDVAIPTFQASIIRDFKRADGYGTHPNAEVAIEMALLEAAQTIASAVAGGREDLSIRARSLGRHERPRPISVADAWFWLDPDTRYTSIESVDDFSSDNVDADLQWSLDRIRCAGVATLPAIEMTTPEISPAHVVRVILPGLETNNPFYTGDRARLVLLRDLLPRWR